MYPPFEELFKIVANFTVKVIDYIEIYYMKFKENALPAVLHSFLLK